MENDKSPSENLTCRICEKIYTNPVILACSHSFCKNCLDQKRENKCRRCSTPWKRPYIVNQDLMDICEEKKKRIDLAQNKWAVCMVHTEKCVMFCKEDRKLVCSYCMEQDHQEHTFCTITKMAQDYKNQLQGPLQKLDKKLLDLKSKKSLYLSAIPELQDQTNQVEKHIKEEFEKLNQFLEEEQSKKIDALRKEENEKISILKQKIAEVEESISDLSTRIKEIKVTVNGDPSLFIQTFRDSKNKAMLPVPDPWLPSGHHIDVVKHSGNLRFKVWEKMQDVCPYYPVILDPNTKRPNVNVSPDLTSITNNSKSKNNHYWHVLGSEGYDSGTHTWEVEVEKCDYWFLGVVKESEKEEENKLDCPLSLSGLKAKSISPNITKVCVVLDVDKGQVTFTDRNMNMVLKTQPHKFTEKMFPGFIMIGKDPLKIIPAKV